MVGLLNKPLLDDSSDFDCFPASPTSRGLVRQLSASAGSGEFRLRSAPTKRFFGGLAALSLFALITLCSEGYEQGLFQAWMLPVTPYTDVQYFGFNLFTAAGTAADGCFDYNRSSTAKCYLGSSKLEEDLHSRMGIMLKAIENAYEGSHWDRSNTTLKIYMAPEFFWRGPRGAYELSPSLARHARQVFAKMQDHLSDERFSNWVFVLGTVVAVRFDSRTEGGMGDEDRLTYYNFAPIQIGGERTMYVQFKHHISTIDFPEAKRTDADHPEPFALFRRSDCYINRGAAGCGYGVLSTDLMETEFGFDSDKVLQDGTFNVKGLRIGIEICLDHMVGTLDAALGSHRTVDVHLISSAGMYIAAGPVCTRQGSPIFLADGFARTAMSLNLYGRGRESTKLPTGRTEYNVGMVYGADSVVALQEWIGNTIEAFTGKSFGVRPAGFGTLPGSAEGDTTGIQFRQISALGDTWLEQLDGFYDTSSYKEAARFYKLVKEDAESHQKAKKITLFDALKNLDSFQPTIDVYGPVPIFRS